MTKVGDRVKCPECGRAAHVVWISQQGKIIAIKCTAYHSQISPPPTEFRKKTQTKTKKGMVFLVEVS